MWHCNAASRIEFSRLKLKSICRLINRKSEKVSGFVGVFGVSVVRTALLESFVEIDKFAQFSAFATQAIASSAEAKFNVSFFIIVFEFQLGRGDSRQFIGPACWSFRLITALIDHAAVKR